MPLQCPSRPTPVTRGWGEEFAGHAGGKKMNETWFSPLPKGDEEMIEVLIQQYGYVRLLAAIIRKMDKDAGKQNPNADPDALGI